MLAMKNNPDRLSALGYDINKFKLLAFILSGGITALAGGLYAMMIGIASLESIDLDRSEIILLITIIGGTNRLSASILGAVFYVMLSNWLRSEEHTSELQSLMRISYAVFCLKQKNKNEYKSLVTTYY